MLAQPPVQQNGTPYKTAAILSTANLVSLNASQVGGGGVDNPFMKVKYIRSLKEWAVYWKYYADQPSHRAQLLEKLMQTESLREKFTQSEELKPKVFKDSLDAENPVLSELCTILMADTIDLDRVRRNSTHASLKSCSLNLICLPAV